MRKRRAPEAAWQPDPQAIRSLNQAFADMTPSNEAEPQVPAPLIASSGDPFTDLISGAQATAAAAGWTTYVTEDGWVGARRPQHELDYIHSLARPDLAQKVYLYVARDMIARDQGEQALADVRAVLATEGLITIDSSDSAYLAEAIYNKDSENRRAVSWWEDPQPKVHPKFGPPQTSPYSRLRRAFHRERAKRRMDGLLPRLLLHGDAAVIAMNRVALSRRAGFKVDWQGVYRWLRDTGEERTATELEDFLAGETVEEMGLTNYHHLQRRLPRIGGLVLRHHYPEHPKD